MGNDLVVSHSQCKDNIFWMLPCRCCIFVEMGQYGISTACNSSPRDPHLCGGIKATWRFCLQYVMQRHRAKAVTDYSAGKLWISSGLEFGESLSKSWKGKNTSVHIQSEDWLWWSSSAHFCKGGNVCPCCTFRIDSFSTNPWTILPPSWPSMRLSELGGQPCCLPVSFR